MAASARHRHATPGVLFLLCGSFLLGVAFVIAVPAGWPYDEPAHWSNVLFYLDHRSLPVLGDPGVSYEAQMGPVAYVLDALVAAPTRALFGTSAAFYAVRILGLVEHLGLVFVVWRIISIAGPTEPRVALTGAAVIALNPMFLAMSGSVQNDTLSLLVGFTAVLVTLQARTVVGAAVAGGLLGIALLAKLTVWPLVLVVTGYWLLRRRTAGLVCGLMALAVAGWWFIRNQHLYGDITARKGVEAAGFAFPSLGGIHPLDLARSAATYLWVPTEYTRNLVAAPGLIDALVVIAAAAGLLGLVMLASSLTSLPRNARRTIAVLAAAGALGVVSWVVTASFVQAVAFRVAYVCIPLWALGLGALSRSRRVPTMATLVVVQVGLSIWFLAALGGVDEQPFTIRF